jgi:hypothetical protein
VAAHVLWPVEQFCLHDAHDPAQWVRQASSLQVDLHVLHCVTQVSLHWPQVLWQASPQLASAPSHADEKPPRVLASVQVNALAATSMLSDSGAWGTYLQSFASSATTRGSVHSVGGGAAFATATTGFPVPCALAPGLGPTDAIVVGVAVAKAPVVGSIGCGAWHAAPTTTTVETRASVSLE